MMTAREALRKAIARSSPTRARELQEMIGRGTINMVEGDERPEFIIGGFWPSSVPGAVRADCADCQRYIALSPDSGAQFAAAFPDVPTICFDCALQREREEKARETAEAP